MRMEVFVYRKSFVYGVWISLVMMFYIFSKVANSNQELQMNAFSLKGSTTGFGNKSRGYTTLKSTSVIRCVSLCFLDKCKCRSIIMLKPENECDLFEELHDDLDGIYGNGDIHYYRKDKEVDNTFVVDGGVKIGDRIIMQCINPEEEWAHIKLWDKEKDDFFGVYKASPGGTFIESKVEGVIFNRTSIPDLPIPRQRMFVIYMIVNASGIQVMVDENTYFHSLNVKNSGFSMARATGSFSCSEILVC